MSETISVVVTDEFKEELDRIIKNHPDFDGRGQFIRAAIREKIARIQS
jgi:metal-responsive CopG/Arc/MetJ family transcriptional regulator